MMAADHDSQGLSKQGGFLLVDKASGETCHSLAKGLKRLCGFDKVGYLGVLDPFASGLLIFLFNHTTRLAHHVIDNTKTYVFTVTLGVETSTLDVDGKVTLEKPVPSDCAQRLEGILPYFRGAIQQIPPEYSALKMQGKPLYAHMRSTGFLPQAIETKKRVVHIYHLDLVDSQSPCFTFRVQCSKGTYIRSLARDLAQALGTVGHCSALRRTGIDPWDVQNALSLSSHQLLQLNKNDVFQRILPPTAMLPKIPILQWVSEDFLPPFSNGHAADLGYFINTDDHPFQRGDRVFVWCFDKLILCEILIKIKNQIEYKIVQPRKWVG